MWVVVRAIGRIMGWVRSFLCRIVGTLCTTSSWGAVSIKQTHVGCVSRILRMKRVFPHLHAWIVDNYGLIAVRECLLTGFGISRRVLLLVATLVAVLVG